MYTLFSFVWTFTNCHDTTTRDSRPASFGSFTLHCARCTGFTFDCIRLGPAFGVSRRTGRKVHARCPRHLKHHSLSMIASRICFLGGCLHTLTGMNVWSTSTMTDKKVHTLAMMEGMGGRYDYEIVESMKRSNGIAARARSLFISLSLSLFRSFFFASGDNRRVWYYCTRQQIRPC